MFLLNITTSLALPSQLTLMQHGAREATYTVPTKKKKENFSYKYWEMWQ